MQPFDVIRGEEHNVHERHSAELYEGKESERGWCSWENFCHEGLPSSSKAQIINPM